MIWLLLAVQFVEVLWVLFNYVGIEQTTSVGGVVRLSYMPYSHSVVTILGYAVIAWAVLGLGFRQTALSAAIGMGIGSHLVLDLATHNPDITVAPWLDSIKLGSGLYNVPLLAFVVELSYGVACWWIFKGSGRLLAAILVLNAVNLPLFLLAGGTPNPAIPNESHNLLVVNVVFAEILITWFVIWWLSREEKPRLTGAISPA